MNGVTREKRARHMRRQMESVRGQNRRKCDCQCQGGFVQPSVSYMETHNIIVKHRPHIKVGLRCCFFAVWLNLSPL